ncbi:hypothetical protein [Candidatus Nitrospira allomarina]|jgi:hypothetical protein|uniref:Uncharacterized protein n=1 Tax=Candidatus Nitrospira allomarina TaxID=3020900 RepID=A0AA96JRB2_9BACT|nr:hypothetical protein [Candidatus Nitrospira allomarina]WNM56923.1 hypothetical protein PP769_13160 [Candidatus Nitrospira allomarina]
MEILTLVIAIVALVIAIMAFQRTGGGMRDLRRQIEDLTEKSEHATKGARDMTADALSRLETFIRGQQKPAPSQQVPLEDKLPTTPQTFSSTEQEKPIDEPPTTQQTFPSTESEKPRDEPPTTERKP